MPHGRTGRAGNRSPGQRGHRRTWPEREATRPGQTRQKHRCSRSMLPRLLRACLPRPSVARHTGAWREETIMRNIPIPVDTGRLTFVCVTDPRPRLVSQDSGRDQDRPQRPDHLPGWAVRGGRVRAGRAGQRQRVRRAPGPRRPGRAARRAGRLRLGAGPRRPDPMGHRLPRRLDHPGSPWSRPRERAGVMHTVYVAGAGCPGRCGGPGARLAPPGHRPPTGLSLASRSGRCGST